MRVPKPLTARFVEAVKQPGRFSDGRGSYGLMLNVHTATDGRTTKSWIQRIWLNGKAKQIGLGPYPVVSLSEARKAALENKRIVFSGRDPRTTTTTPAFAQGLDAVIAIQREGWKDGKSEAQWRASLRDYAGALMHKPVDMIVSADVLAALKPIWHTKYTTAKRVRQRISAVMKWTIAQGHRTDDPAGAVLDPVLPKNGTHKQHHKALPYADVSAALATVRASDAYVPTVLAFEFLVLTAARSGEVRGARWNEIDLDARTWTVPGERMKTGREHRVPLSDRAIEILTEARAINPDSDLIFPTVTGRMIQAPVLSALLRENKIEAVPHGFRSSFRQWTAECTDFPREVCEHALAHVGGNQVEAAYQRSDLFAKRAELMNQWAQYVVQIDG